MVESQNAAAASPAADTATLCGSNKGFYCEGSNTNSPISSATNYLTKDYYRYGQGAIANAGYTYASGEWFMHAELGCSPIQMLYACTAGTINGVCTTCATGFTLDAADNVCKPTTAGNFGYDWTASAAKVTSHTVYSNEQVFAPFAENSASIDWRDWGVITPVQDVGSTCAATYAQTAADLAAAAWSIKTGTANVVPSI